MEAISLGFRVALAATFALAAVGKLSDRRSSERVRVASAGELALVVGLLVDRSAVPAAIVALAVLVAGLLRSLWGLARGEESPCRCFGRWSPSQLGWREAARNGFLAALAGLVVVHGPSVTSLTARLGVGAAAFLLALGAVFVGLARRRSALRLVAGWSVEGL